LWNLTICELYLGVCPKHIGSSIGIAAREPYEKVGVRRIERSAQGEVPEDQVDSFRFLDYLNLDGLPGLFELFVKPWR